MKKPKPIEVFDELVWKGFMRYSPFPHGPGPGGMITRLTDEEREALKNLTSDEVGKRRFPF